MGWLSAAGERADHLNQQVFSFVADEMVLVSEPPDYNWRYCDVPSCSLDLTSCPATNTTDRRDANCCSDILFEMLRCVCAVVCVCVLCCTYTCCMFMVFRSGTRKPRATCSNGFPWVTLRIAERKRSFNHWVLF